MAARSNPYLAQANALAPAPGEGEGEGGQAGPTAPPAVAPPQDDGAAADGAQRTRASFVRRSFSRRSTVGGGGGGATSEGSFSSQGVGEYDPPSAMEIIEYAKYLGMNPIYDADLLWIAAEGLTAPLPAGWTEHEDQDSNLYFYNTATDHSTREHPLDKHYRQTYLNEKRKKEQLAGGAAEEPVEQKKGKFGGLFSKTKDEAAPDQPPAELDLPAPEEPLAAAGPPPGTGSGSAPTTAEGSEPTLVLVPADIRDMAVYLGIHIRTESDMLWIARESLTASLPPRWEELEDEAGHPYYYNLVTGTTTRKHPLDHYFVQLARFERWNPERKRQPAEAWMDFVDSQGRTYYYNFSNDQTTYDRPANVIDDDTIRWFSVGKKAQLENYLATRIQAAARGRQARKRLSALKNLDTLRDLLAAKKIQYAWRTRVAAKYVVRWHNSVRRGMSWGIWRHRAKARSGFQTKVRRSEAALTIQRYWRGHMTRAYVGHVKNRLQEMKAALKIQAAWRGASTRKRVKKTKAAIKTRQIQDEARMRRLRDERTNNYHEQLAVKQKNLWQKDAWKKWCVALEPRVEFQAKVKRIRAAVTIQRRARSWIMHRRIAVHAERVQRFQFITRLQAKWRGIGARRRFKYAKAATQIQSGMPRPTLPPAFVHLLSPTSPALMLRRRLQFGVGAKFACVSSRSWRRCASSASGGAMSCGSILGKQPAQIHCARHAPLTRVLLLPQSLPGGTGDPGFMARILGSQAVSAAVLRAPDSVPVARLRCPARFPCALRCRHHPEVLARVCHSQARAAVAQDSDTDGREDSGPLPRLFDPAFSEKGHSRRGGHPHPARLETGP